MTREESVIRTILCMRKAGKSDIRILVYAVEKAGELMFKQGIPMEQIPITTAVYGKAGEKFKKSNRAAARQIERLSILCWDSMDKEDRIKYIGDDDGYPSPREIVFCLAYYCRYCKSYQEVIREKMKEAFEENPAKR